MVRTQSLFAATEVSPQEFLVKKNGGVTVMLVTGTAAPPLLATVIDCGSELVPTGVDPKAMSTGLRDIDPVLVPIPVRSTRTAPAWRLPAMASCPVRVPGCVGKTA